MALNPGLPGPVDGQVALLLARFSTLPPRDLAAH